MASVDVTIAGRAHELACRDGEEAQVRRLAALVDAKAIDAARAMGGMSEARQMLFAALMLADELNDARETIARAAAPPPLPDPAPAPDPAPDPAIATTVAILSERVERLAALLDRSGRLETPPASA